MNNHQPTGIGIILIAAVVLFTIASFRQEAQNYKPQSQQDEDDRC